MSIEDIKKTGVTEDCEAEFSRFIANLQYEDIDDETIEYCKLLVADYIAASVAGRKINPVMNQAAENIILGMGGKPEAGVFFNEQKLPVLNAAFLFGVYSHGADIDDGHKVLMGHPGAPVISAVLPLAQKLGSDGKTAITAIVCGYEVTVALAEVMQPELVNRGYHSTGVIGSVGAAAAVARMLKLNQAETESALALAMTQAGGLLMVAESGQMSKPVNPARAAYSGILAAMLAADGVQGSSNSLSSSKGYLHAFAGEIDASDAVNSLCTAAASGTTAAIGKDFKLKGSYFKPYPSCRHTHGAIDAIRSLRDKYESIDEIKAINIYIYNHAISIAGQIVEPKNVDDTKFSIQYATACTADIGNFGMNELSAYQQNCKKYRDLLRKIQLIGDDSLEKITEGIRGTRVELQLTDGSVFTEEVLIPKGDPEKPFTWDDMKNKFEACSSGVLSAEKQEQIIDAVRKLEHAEELETLVRLIQES